MANLTVSVEAIKDYPALLMKWGETADPTDIKKAYEVISDALSVAQSPLFVIVDLSENRYMPLRETVSGALFGPYNHRNLDAWLVIGGHQIARMVASSLSQVTRQHKVEWFANMEAAMARLHEMVAKTG